MVSFTHWPYTWSVARLAVLWALHGLRLASSLCTLAVLLQRLRTRVRPALNMQHEVKLVFVTWHARKEPRRCFYGVRELVRIGDHDASTINCMYMYVRGADLYELLSNQTTSWAKTSIVVYKIHMCIMCNKVAEAWRQSVLWDVGQTMCKLRLVCCPNVLACSRACVAVDWFSVPSFWQNIVFISLYLIFFKSSLAACKL